MNDPIMNAIRLCSVKWEHSDMVAHDKTILMIQIITMEGVIIRKFVNIKTRITSTLMKLVNTE
jgi:hypothetical protein